MKPKKIVCIGGGTGLSTLLRGLKHYYEPSAIVTMADSGGHSGILRDELGVLPPGDVRACLVALASDDKSTLLRDLFNYRFMNGSYSGASVGNLLLTALSDILGDFNQAVQAAHDLLGLKGRVIPVTLEPVDLLAELEDGTILFGEKAIGIPRKTERLRLKRVWLQPKVSINPLARAAIVKADAILFGPGDLYTSILPNLYVHGVLEAIDQSKAKLIYITNIMTRHGETDGFKVEDFVATIQGHLPRKLDWIIYNTKHIPLTLLEKYKIEYARPVRTEAEEQNWVGADMLSIGANLARHNSGKLAKVLHKVIDNGN